MIVLADGDALRLQIGWLGIQWIFRWNKSIVDEQIGEIILNFPKPIFDYTLFVKFQKIKVFHGQQVDYGESERGDGEGNAPFWFSKCKNRQIQWQQETVKNNVEMGIHQRDKILSKPWIYKK